MSQDDRKRRLAIAVLIGSVLSILGALYMIFCFVCIKSLRTYRHQLILGLAVADLALAINFFVPTVSQLRNIPQSMPATNPVFCLINGFLTQLFFSQIDMWQLTIAVVTLLLLSGPSDTLRWAREHVLVIWIFPWVVSIATAFLAFGLWMYGTIGPFCWLPSTHIRLYFNYIPRWFVIFTCLVIYIRIFYIIRRARKVAMIQRACENYQNRGASPFLMAIDKEYNMSNSTSGIHSMNISRSASMAEISSAGTTATEPQAVIEADMEESYTQQEAEAEEQQRQIRRIAVQLISFPLAYAVLWTIPTVVMIYEVASGNVGNMSTEIECMSKLLLVFNGFVDAHVYGFNERTALGWKQKIRDVENPAARRQARDSFVHEVVSRPGQAVVARE